MPTLINKNELVQIALVRRPTFTGIFGNYQFTNGVSEPMTRREAERLSVITTVEFVDSANMWERKSVERGILSGKVEESAEETQEPVEAPPAPKPPGGRVEFTRQDLEAIADKKGLAGLREIGDPMGIKAVAISSMIRQILAAQEAKARGE